MDKKFKNYWNKDKNNSIINSKLVNIYIVLLKKFPFINKKLNLILKLPKNWKVLDVWVWSWSFLKIIKKLRKDLILYWIDVTDSWFKKIPKDIKVKVWSWDKIDYESNYFDLVINQHVLEHVNNPEVFFEEFKRVTKKYIIIVTPNHTTTWLWWKLNFYSDPTHIRPHNIPSLKFLANQSELKIVNLFNERYFNLPLIILILFFPIFIIKQWLSDYFGNIIFKRWTTLICKKENAK